MQFIACLVRHERTRQGCRTRWTCNGRQRVIAVREQRHEAGSTMRERNTAFTLVELLVVIILIGIVVTLAVLSQGNANEILERQNAAGELKIAFERARFDSVKRRADGVQPFPFASVEVRNNGFTLRTYTRAANAATATVQETSKTFPTGVTLSHYSTGTLPMTITYNRRGETAGGSPHVCTVSPSGVRLGVASPTDQIAASSRSCRMLAD